MILGIIFRNKSAYISAVPFITDMSFTVSIDASNLTCSFSLYTKLCYLENAYKEQKESITHVAIFLMQNQFESINNQKLNLFNQRIYIEIIQVTMHV